MSVTQLPILGKTITEITVSDDKTVVTIKTADAEYDLVHGQECCEHVELIDVDGDLKDLIGYPLLQAELVSSTEVLDEELVDNMFKTIRDGDAFEWSFYKFATIKGYVTLRWLGVSNGYYSMDVSLVNRTVEDKYERILSDLQSIIDEFGGRKATRDREKILIGLITGGFDEDGCEVVIEGKEKELKEFYKKYS